MRKRRAPAACWASSFTAKRTKRSQPPPRPCRMSCRPRVRSCWAMRKKPRPAWSWHWSPESWRKQSLWLCPPRRKPPQRRSRNPGPHPSPRKSRSRPAAGNPCPRRSSRRMQRWPNSRPCSMAPPSLPRWRRCRMPPKRCWPWSRKLPQRLRARPSPWCLPRISR